MSTRTVTTILAAIAALVLAGCAASSADAPAVANSAPGTSKAAPTQPAAPTKAAPTQAPPTTSQSNALEAAKNYLSMDSGFSRAGLIEQLSSKAGDGYPVADATWAVAHCGADWNAQAVLSAKSYLALMPMSRSGLIEQLSSKAGSGFTKAQATYAANQVGLK